MPSRPLDGARVKFLRRVDSGDYVVELLEDRKAYKKGDQIQINPSEYESDQ